MQLSTLGGWAGFAVQIAAGGVATIWPTQAVVGWILFAGGVAIWIASAIWYFTHRHPTEPLPKLTLFALVMRQLGDLADETQGSSAEELLISLERLASEIQLKARLGYLTLWGRKNAPDFWSNIPLSEISPAFWERSKIDHVDYLRGGEHHLGCAHTGSMDGKDDYYVDLQFNKRQVAKIWPRKLPRVRFELPSVLKRS